MKWVHTFIIGTVITFSALFLGYSLYQPDAGTTVEKRVDITPDRGVVTDENTMMEYVYEFDEDGVRQTAYSPIPPYLVDLTQSRFEEKMPNFNVTYFTAEKVSVQRKMQGKSREHYTLGEKDGYVAVFYLDGGGLKEITNTPITTLSNDELELLGNTEIVGNEKLIRLLEDLES